MGVAVGVGEVACGRANGVGEAVCGMQEDMGSSREIAGLKRSSRGLLETFAPSIAVLYI